MKVSSKRKSILTLVIFSIICICIYLYNSTHSISDTNSTINYSYNIYNKKEDLLSNSKIIIRGNVVDLEVKNINIAPENSPDMIIEYKVASILATDVIKGDVEAGKTIEVKYPNNDGAGMSNSLDDLMSIDSDCLLFLNNYDDFDSTIPYSVVNPLQGVIKLNIFKDEDPSYENPLNLFNDIPNENIIDYLKNNL